MSRDQRIGYQSRAKYTRRGTDACIKTSCCNDSLLYHNKKNDVRQKFGVTFDLVHVILATNMHLSRPMKARSIFPDPPLTPRLTAPHSFNGSTTSPPARPLTLASRTAPTPSPSSSPHVALGPQLPPRWHDPYPPPQAASGSRLKVPLSTAATSSLVTGGDDGLLEDGHVYLQPEQETLPPSSAMRCPVHHHKASHSFVRGG